MHLKPQFIILILLFIYGGLTHEIYGQNISIYGYVQDSINGETLIGATVKNKESIVGTVTNNYGYFSLSVPSNTLQIICSYVGYQSKTIDIKKSKFTK